MYGTELPIYWYSEIQKEMNSEVIKYLALGGEATYEFNLCNGISLLGQKVWDLPIYRVGGVLKSRYLGLGLAGGNIWVDTVIAPQRTSVSAGIDSSLSKNIGVEIQYDNDPYYKYENMFAGITFLDILKNWDFKLGSSWYRYNLALNWQPSLYGSITNGSLYIDGEMGRQRNSLGVGICDRYFRFSGVYNRYASGQWYLGGSLGL
ncbi:MAG: hypothetical protein QXU67_05935, partial [Candidatus Bathyarchaeia archaeon]